MECISCGYRNRVGSFFCGACGRSLGPGSAGPVDDPGEVSFVAGRYEVERLLGEGRRRRVYLARDVWLGRPVAFALLKTGGLDGAEVARIHGGARVLAGLGDHPNIVRLYDAGEDAGRLYTVSQYVAGGSLAQRLAAVGGSGLPFGAVVGIARGLCAALVYAHASGVIHGDLEPTKVWLAADGTPKLGDFGLPAVDATGRTAIDGRVDLHALGVLLDELLQGPRTRSPDADPVASALAEVIGRLVADEVAVRPVSAAALAADLAALDTPDTTRPARPATSSSRAPRPVTPLDPGVLDDRLKTIVVGRSAELARLRAALDVAAGGSGVLVLVSGGPGIGKTTLARELAKEATARGARVLWGRCHEDEGPPAYWPWIQIVRAHLAGRDRRQLAEEMGPGAAAVAEVVAELRERLPDLPEPTPLDAPQARFRLFDAIASFLGRAAAAQPLVLILDDLHWADQPSLQLLEFVVREMGDSRLLVVVTHRDTDPRRREPLARAAGRLARHPCAQQLDLVGLSSADVGRFVELTTGVAPTDGLVDAVRRQSNGNPFLVAELVRLLAAEDRLHDTDRDQPTSLPDGVRAVMGRRLSQLSQDALHVLTVAAVTGDDFGIDVVRQVADLDDERFFDALDEVVRARVVTEHADQPGRYRWDHALIRQAVTDETRTARRVHLHRLVGEAIETAHRGDLDAHLGELARHFYEAATTAPDKALDYAVRAARRCAEVHGYDEAADHYERALEVVELAGAAAPRSRGELLLALGGARRRAGNSEGAVDALLQAAERARRISAVELLARIAVELADTLEDNLAGDHRARELLEEAISLHSVDDGPLRARLLGALALAVYRTDQPRADALSLEAVGAARRSGDAAALAAVLGHRRYVVWGGGTLEQRLALADDVLRLADGTTPTGPHNGAASPEELVLRARSWRVMDLLEQGDVVATDAEIDAHARLADRLRQPQHQSYTAIFRATRAIMEGRYAEGEILAGEALRLGQLAQNPHALALHGAQVFRARMEQGVEGLEALVLGYLATAPDFTVTRIGMTYTLAIFGRLDEAREKFETLAAHGFADLPVDLTWLQGIARLARVCTILDDAPRASMLYRLLQPYRSRVVVTGPPPIDCWGPVSLYLGLLAATAGDDERAAWHLEHALATSERMRTPPLAAHIRYEYAGLLVAHGDRRRGQQLLAEARDTCERLGMVLLARRIDTFGERSGERG